MWALVIALGIVGGLVKVAYGQSVEPTFKPAWRRAKLIRLARISPERLTINEAEDGLVLAREFEAPELSKRFASASDKLKQSRKEK